MCSIKRVSMSVAWFNSHLEKAETSESAVENKSISETSLPLWNKSLILEKYLLGIGSD